MTKKNFQNISFSHLSLASRIKQSFPVVGLLIFLSLFLVLNLAIYPVEVKKIEVGTFSALQEGKFNGTGLDSEGRLFIGPVIKKIDGPGREYYLSLDVAPDGSMYIGTGHKAAVYHVDSKRTDTPVEEIFMSDYLDVYAIHLTENGDLYVGTAPGGRLYKIKSGKKYSVKNGSDIFEIQTGKDPAPVKESALKNIEIYNPDEKFIWDIKQDKQGNIVFAVGGSGGVYKIDKTGTVKKIFSPGDSHIMSLCVCRDNSILAGSGDRGVLYKIEKNKAKVLADSPLEEIKGICEDADGNIFFSAGKGFIHRQGNKKESVEFEPFSKQQKKVKQKPITETAILYCLHTNGVVERIWDSEEEYIYTLAYDKKTDSVLFGTGNSGRIYRINKEGDFSILYESESAQVYKIREKNGQFIAITNNTAGITRIEENLNTQGYYLSKIFDLGIQSQLGRLYWELDTSAGESRKTRGGTQAASANASTSGKVMLSVRTGNSNFPDNSWSAWSAPFTDAENSTINVSGTRYFQVKVAMNSGVSAQTPYLDNFRVYYIQSNLTPHIEKIQVSKPDPKKTANSHPLILSREKDDRVPLKKRSKLEKYLVASWKVTDPNNDTLKYTIYLKKTSDQSWILFKENCTEKKVEINTALFEDGKYQLRLVADDYLSNPPDAARSDSKISSPFIIDSTAPTIGNFTVKGKKIDFRVTDSISLISGVSISMDGESWYPLFPVDKINDSRSESYRLDLDNTEHLQSCQRNKKSKKIIFIKAIDEFDNYKVFQREI